RTPRTIAGPRSGRDRIDRAVLPGAAPPLEADHAVDQREQRVVLPAAPVLDRMELGSPLPDQDVAGQDELPAETLHAEPLRVRVAAVPAGADSFLVRHSRPPSPEPDLVDPDLGVLLPVALLPAVVLPTLPLEDDDLLALAVRDDLGFDGGTLEGRAPHAALAVGLRQQDLVERDRLTDLGGERRDPDRLSGLGPELLTAGADDRVHGLSRCIQSTDITRSSARSIVSRSSGRAATPRRAPTQRVARRDVRPRRARQQPELGLPHQRVVPQVEVEVERLLETLEQPRLLFQDVQRHLRVDADDDATLGPIHGDSPDRPLDAAHHGVRREDATGPATVRARLGQRLEERRAHALARHLHQAELRDLERAGARPVAGEVRAELLEHPLLVRAGLHVNEVADDDAAHIAEPELARDLPGRIQVGAQDRLLRVLAPGVAAGVDVDGDQRLGRFNDDVAAGRQVHAPLERLADRLLDAVLVEERDRVGVEVDPVQQLR